MSADVTVCVATYGDYDEWAPLAQRACESVDRQTLQPRCTTWIHGPSLWEARNEAAKVETEWLIFLDADDELDERYVEAMLNASSGDIRRPATLGVYPNGTTDDYPVMIPERNIFTSNYIVISSMIRTNQFWQAGGFDDLPILEDWDLFIRLWLAGADIVSVPDAIYRVTVRDDSRNQNHALHNAVYNQIRGRYIGRSRPNHPVS